MERGGLTSQNDFVASVADILGQHELGCAIEIQDGSFPVPHGVFKGIRHHLLRRMEDIEFGVDMLGTTLCHGTFIVMLTMDCLELRD